VPPGEEECLMSCEVVKGSADGDAEWYWRAQIQVKKRQWGMRSVYAAEQPIHAEQRRTGMEVKSLEWNRGAPNRGWGGDWGVRKEKAIWSAEWNIEAPIQTEEGRGD
jgi:hypothetical protein